MIQSPMLHVQHVSQALLREREKDALVGVLRHSPPARGEELRSSLSLEVRKVCAPQRISTRPSQRKKG